ncbi:MAG TPA: multidrug ABC transporter ATP-binding protein [Firmicutes bacterium]|nr:multidrug ABC transporter ATP-binding protein [Bacillota bacterium]
MRRGPGGRGPGGPGGMHGMGAPVEKAKDFKGTVKKLLVYLGGYKIAVLFVMIFAVCSTVFAIVGPKILGNATTELFNGIMGKIAGTSEGVDFTAIGSILLRLIGLYLISALFQFIQGFIMTGVSNKITYRLRKDIDEKIHNMPFSFYDRVTVGEVLSLITNDVDVINHSFNQSITQIITSVTMLIGILVMMFSISWQMTLIAIMTLPVSLVVVGLIIKKSQKHFVNQQKYLGNVNSIVEENFSCHTIVKAFNGEERSLKQFRKSNNTLYASAWKANFLSGLMMPIMNIIGNIGYVVVCVLGGYLATQGRLTVGNIQAFIQYMRQFTQPILQISQISNVLQQTIAASERVFGFLDEAEEIPEAPNALTICSNGDTPLPTDVAIAGHISFEDVSFGYTADKIVIKKLNSDIKPGQTVAIVGPTGAGKTTIVKLLMRFYDVTSGAIRLDGHDIREFKRDELRSVFGMVLQDTWLYNGTIADNIRYGKLDATDNEVREAAKVAQCDHFINTLPDGYHMVLNEEASNVSHGQKQLLTIARAVLADPKILILDEATSSVDTRTEILIQKAVANLMRGRTSFIIAHRLSTIRNADLILVMNHGDIIEQGTHEELLAQRGFYASLYDSQFAEVG